MSKTKRKRLRGKVQKVLKPIVPLEPEKAQISVDEADELYRDIRVENALTYENGEKVRLKLGAEVDVILQGLFFDTFTGPIGNAVCGAATRAVKRRPFHQAYTIGD